MLEAVWERFINGVGGQVYGSNGVQRRGGEESGRDRSYVQSASQRPPMSEVVAMLSRKEEYERLELTRPAFLGGTINVRPAPSDTAPSKTPGNSNAVMTISNLSARWHYLLLYSFFANVVVSIYFICVCYIPYFLLILLFDWPWSLNVVHIVVRSMQPDWFKSIFSLWSNLQRWLNL